MTRSAPYRPATCYCLWQIYAFAATFAFLTFLCLVSICQRVFCPRSDSGCRIAHRSTTCYLHLIWHCGARRSPTWWSLRHRALDALGCCFMSGWSKCLCVSGFERLALWSSFTRRNLRWSSSVRICHHPRDRMNLCAS